MGAASTDLHDSAVELLVASIEALDTIPTYAPALEGAPERTFVSPGPPSFDCCPGDSNGQLTVHVALIADAQLEAGNAQGRLIAGKKNHVAFVVTIIRCITDNRTSPNAGFDEAPYPADQEATAQQTNADIWALWNHLYNLWRSDGLFTLCGEVFFDARVLNQQGGCAGWELNIRTTLDGYLDIPTS